MVNTREKRYVLLRTKKRRAARKRPAKRVEHRNALHAVSEFARTEKSPLHVVLAGCPGIGSRMPNRGAEGIPPVLVGLSRSHA